MRSDLETVDTVVRDRFYEVLPLPRAGGECGVPFRTADTGVARKCYKVLLLSRTGGECGLPFRHQILLSGQVLHGGTGCSIVLHGAMLSRAGGECGVPFERRIQMPLSAPDKPWYSYELGPIHLLQYSTEHPFGQGTTAAPCIVCGLCFEHDCECDDYDVGDIICCGTARNVPVARG